MAEKQYKVLESSYIHDKLVQPGDIVNWDEAKHGKAGPNLEPLKKSVATKRAVETDGDDSSNDQLGDNEGEI